MGKQIRFNSAQYNSSVLREHGFLPPQELKERFGYQVEALLSTVFYGEDYEAEDLMYLISTQRDTDTHKIEGRFLYNMEYMPEWYILSRYRNIESKSSCPVCDCLQFRLRNFEQILCWCLTIDRINHHLLWMNFFECLKPSNDLLLCRVIH